jgi:hypothetical protein
MPPKARKNQLKTAREALLEKQSSTLDGEAQEDVDGLKSRLYKATQQIQLLEQQLADQVKVCDGLQYDLNASRDLVNMLRSEILSLKAKNSNTNHQLRIERQRYKRASLKNGSMKYQIALLEKANAISTKGLMDSANINKKILKMNNDLQNELSQTVVTWSSQTEAIKSKLISSDTRLKNVQKEVSKLRKSCHRAAQVKNHAVETAKAKVVQQKSVHHLANKGVFTEDTRNLVRLLSQAGCSANHISEIITAVLKTAGITTIGSISRTSVSRIIREGYFAAQIQLGYEMKMAESMTFSADGTGHRSINYNSRHAHMLVEEYGSSENKKIRATRFLGIKPS